MKPYYETSDGKIYQGHALEVLETLPDQSVNCCVTSPPYWGLRDYGNDGQIGLEPTPETYVAKMVDVFDEVRRVLTDDGTCWVNLGDSYCSTGGPQVVNTINSSRNGGSDTQNKGESRKPVGNLKPKDLVGIPWRVAFALQAAGWYLRQDIIWHKPNPMPESVNDRCTKAHEYIFLLSKSRKYYFDNKSINEPAQYGEQHAKKTTSWGTNRKHPNKNNVEKYAFKGNNHTCGIDGSGKYTRNKRSVWKVSTKPFSGAHFAVFPPGLIEPCIMAGCPKGGTVLDPFIGSGTTAIVAYKHDRKFIGIDLSQKYLDEIAIPRIEAETRQMKLFN